jgi:hypothetical protein
MHNADNIPSSFECKGAIGFPREDPGPEAISFPSFLANTQLWPEELLIGISEPSVAINTSWIDSPYKCFVGQCQMVGRVL